MLDENKPRQKWCFWMPGVGRVTRQVPRTLRDLVFDTTATPNSDDYRRPFDSQADAIKAAIEEWTRFRETALNNLSDLDHPLKGAVEDPNMIATMREEEHKACEIADAALAILNGQ